MTVAVIYTSLVNDDKILDFDGINEFKLREQSEDGG